MNSEDLNIYFNNLKNLFFEIKIEEITKLVNLLELNKKYNKYLKYSRYETTFDINKKKPSIRIIHYPYFSEDITSFQRKLIGRLESTRILNILAFLNLNNNLLMKVLNNVILMCDKVFTFYPHTIVSIEYEFKEISKLSFYIVWNEFRKTQLKSLSNVMSNNFYSIFKNFFTKNIDLFSVDYYVKSNDINFKIYHRFPLRNKNSKVFTAGENKVISMFEDKPLSSIVRLTRINLNDEISKYKKSYLLFKKPVDISSFYNYIPQKYGSLFINRTITNFSFDPKTGKIIELYIN